MFSCGTCLGFLNKCEASLLKVELFLLCDSVYTKWSSGDTHAVGGTIRKGGLEYSAGVSFSFVSFSLMLHYFYVGSQVCVPIVVVKNARKDRLCFAPLEGRAIYPSLAIYYNVRVFALTNTNAAHL